MGEEGCLGTPLLRTFSLRSLEAFFDIGRHILARTGNVDLAS